MRIPKGAFGFLRHHVATPAAVASVTIAPASLTLNVGSSAPLGATVRDSDGTVLPGRTLSWASSNAGVAAIDPDTGQVTGIAAGTANLTATDVLSGVASLPVPVTVQAVGAPSETGKILFLQSAAGVGSMDPSEKTLVDAMVSWGYDVDVVKILGTGGLDLTGYKAAVISASCGYSSTWGPSWKVASIPFLCLSAPAPTELGLAKTNVDLGKIATIERSPIVLPGVDETAPGPFALFTGTNQISVHRWTTPSQDAVVWYHAEADHFSPTFLVYDRGEELADGSTAAARRAFGFFGVKGDFNKWSDTGARLIVRNAMKWLGADPGDTIAPRISYTRAYSPDASSLDASSASTVPAGRTIASLDFVLRDALATADIAGSSASPFHFAPLADGAYHLDLTVTDDLGNSRTKRQLIRAEAVSPITDFSFTREDGSPDNNVVNFQFTGDDRGIAIDLLTAKLYSDAAGTVEAWSGTWTDPDATFPSAGMPNGIYFGRISARNTDGFSSDSGLKKIELPTPPVIYFPRGAKQPAEMHGVGEQAFAYLMIKPAAGYIITSATWNVDLTSVGAGIMTFGGDTLSHPDALHPGAGIIDGKPMFPAAAWGGTFPWWVDVAQSNGWTARYEGVVEAEQDPQWVQHEDYTPPADPPTNRDLYCDAAAATDGDGLTPSTPFKLLSSLKDEIRVGDRVHLSGDFTSQNYKPNLTNLGGGSASLGTVIQQWAGMPQAVLYNDHGSTIMLSGASYAVVRGLHLKMQRIDPITGTYTLGDCIYASDGDHVYAFDCVMEGFNGFHPFRSHDFWLDGCTIIDSGTDVTTSSSNGGYSVKVELSNRGTVVRCDIGNAGHNALEAVQNNQAQGLMPAALAEYPGQLILASDCRFAWNLVVNTWSGGYGPAGGERMLLEHNVFIDTGTAMPKDGPSQVGSHGINFRQDLNLFRFNRVYRAYVGGVQFQSQYNSGRHQCRRNRAYHNTYYNNGNAGPIFADTYHLTPGYRVDEIGFFFEDNVWECECGDDNHGRSNNLPKTYQIYLLITDHEWTGLNVWQNKASGTNRLGSKCAGNIVRNSNLKPLDSEIAAGGGQMLQVDAKGVGTAFTKTATTPADMAVIFENWTGNTADDPVWVSTADPVDWNDTTSLAPDPTSPTYDAGPAAAVAGIDYSAIGGRVPKGWDPGL